MSVQAVTKRHQLNPDWFNYVTQMLLYDEIIIPNGKLWKQFGPLHIHAPTKEYILALKIIAGRQKDLGNFTNAWYGYAKHLRPDLVSSSLERPEQETEHTLRWAAFCTASVEFLCNLYQVTCPQWIHDPHSILATPWWYGKRADDPNVREHIRLTTPTSFADRNIFCGKRLFQNKYELYEWTQEAIAQGMTNPHDIHQYTKQKEINLYGPDL